ncbi:MAG: DUF1295 domain-containing protein [Acholeplasmatales bacterium]|nr:DUF1295 domain-containing protein [Acholeplasmatales bacterium]
MSYKKKFLGLLFLTILYALSFTLGFVLYKFTDMLDVLLRLFILCLTPMVIVYIFGLVLDNTSIINPYWSIQTPVIMMFLMIEYQAFNIGTVLYFMVFTLWAIRLSINYAIEYTGINYEDWRYKKIKQKTGKVYFLVSFFAVFIMPTLVVFVSSLPMYLYIKEMHSFGLWQMIGLGIMTMAIFYQTQADYEMYLFRKNRSSNKVVYESKLWKYSRHPNYFGEMILWMGVCFVYISAENAKWYAIFCCLPVILLHLFISIPLSERHYLSYKDGYDIYKKNTHMLLPIPKRKINKFDVSGYKWVTIYGNAQSKCLPSPQTYAKDVTLRYPIFIPFGGRYVRITLDNFLQEEDVIIDHVIIAKGHELNDKQENPIYVTFNNERRFTIEKGKSIVSDPILYDLVSDEYLVLNIYLKGYTKLTGGVDIVGPLSKGYYAYGDQSLKDKLDLNTSKETSWVYFIANIDVFTEDTNESVICFGDSITSQDWPDYMLLHLREMGIKNVSVIRKAVSGTRVLREYDCITYQSYGKKGKNRFFHEISSVCGCKNIIIQHGINDIIHPVGIDLNSFRPMEDLPTKEELIEGLEYYLKISKRFDLKVYYGTLLPIYGWRTYKEFREELKNKVNDWIKAYPNLIDFEGRISHFEDGAWHFNDEMDSKDHLHPSKKAYDLMGELAARTIYGDLSK